MVGLTAEAQDHLEYVEANYQGPRIASILPDMRRVWVVVPRRCRSATKVDRPALRVATGGNRHIPVAVHLSVVSQRHMSLRTSRGCERITRRNSRSPSGRKAAGPHLSDRATALLRERTINCLTVLSLPEFGYMSETPYNGILAARDNQGVTDEASKTDARRRLFRRVVHRRRRREFPVLFAGRGRFARVRSQAPDDRKRDTRGTDDGGRLPRSTDQPTGQRNQLQVRDCLAGSGTNGTGEPLPGGPLVEEGHIGASSSPVTVSASLSGLQPDYLYWYEVVASNLGGTTRSIANGFLYFHSSSAPNGAIAGPPYAGPEVERTGCLNESGDLAAAETVREQREIEAKEAAAKQAIAKEATAKQAAVKEAEEAALKRRVEEHPAVVLPASCIVPSVKGDTLSAARHAIMRAHCRLGRLRRPSHYDGAPIVTGQTPHRGSTLRDGASVALVLGPARKGSPHKLQTRGTAR
jgi:hypothetical protein